MTFAFFCITEVIRASGHQPTAGTAAMYLIKCSCVMRAREKTEGLTDFTRIFSKVFCFTVENLTWKKGLLLHVNKIGNNFN